MSHLWPPARPERLKAAPVVQTAARDAREHNPIRTEKYNFVLSASLGAHPALPLRFRRLRLSEVDFARLGRGKAQGKEKARPKPGFK
jgi:hypothetical protein